MFKILPILLAALLPLSEASIYRFRRQAYGSPAPASSYSSSSYSSVTTTKAPTVSYGSPSPTSSSYGSSSSSSGSSSSGVNYGFGVGEGAVQLLALGLLQNTNATPPVGSFTGQPWAAFGGTWNAYSVPTSGVGPATAMIIGPTYIQPVSAPVPSINTATVVASPAMSPSSSYGSSSYGK